MDENNRLMWTVTANIPEYGKGTKWVGVLSDRDTAIRVAEDLCAEYYYITDTSIVFEKDGSVRIQGGEDGILTITPRDCDDMLMDIQIMCLEKATRATLDDLTLEDALGIK